MHEYVMLLRCVREHIIWNLPTDSQFHTVYPACDVVKIELIINKLTSTTVECAI